MKLVILDRDGVINHDSDQYIKSPEEWKPIPGSLAAIARLNQAGYRVVVATNQSGIGRGLFETDALVAINDKMNKALALVGGRIDAIFFCNDDLAQGALLAANRMQVAVPQRVAIVGFNDLRGSDLMLPPLTTVHTPLDRIGEEGAAMLLKLMRHEAVPERCIDVGYTVVVRQST